MEDDNKIFDVDGDGKLNDKEQMAYERKAANRRRMSWVALIAMILTAFSLMFLVSDARLEKIKDMLDLYWISLGGIVGAYVGISTWMTKK